jgi:hypothetical protein
VAVAGRAGRFAFTHLPEGRYVLTVRQCVRASSLAPAEVRLTLGFNQKRTGVTVVLRRSATITGTVHATAGAAAGICAEAIPVRATVLPASGGVAITGPGGRYAITGLAAGRYRLLFTPDCPAGAAPAAPAWYGGPAARVITLGSRSTRAGADGVLAADGGVSGAVTGRGSGPLAGVCVTAIPASPTTSLGGAVTGITTSGGRYAIGDLAPGRYRVRFASGCGVSGWRTQWWQGMSAPAVASTVTVTPGLVTNGINATMLR